MFCPQCATQLATSATRCHVCSLDVQPIAHLLRQGVGADPRDPRQHAMATQMQRWKHQRHGWGLLVTMCSLLVGCLIPISLGLFSGYAGLGALITVLAGLAGLLLVLGSMLIMASEGTILTTEDVMPANPIPSQHRPQTGPTTPLLVEHTTAAGTHQDERALHPVQR